jgi:ethanolamine ammonia-lyase large subunit
MALKKITPILLTIGISVITSLLVSGIGIFIYFRTIVPKQTGSLDTQFTKYETIVNGFLDSLRKGEIEAAYKGTSPVFQKKTTLDDFKKLVAGYTSAQNIPAASCSLTEYSEPISSTIDGLPDTYMIVQAKCEATESNEIKGIQVEFIDDKGTPKISYINVYKTSVVHKK